MGAQAGAPAAPPAQAQEQGGGGGRASAAVVPLCEGCGGPLRYYNIGFDDGYQCWRCGSLYEVYGKDGRRRDAPPSRAG
jgi:hypothetical protein